MTTSRLAHFLSLLSSSSNKEIQCPTTPPTVQSRDDHPMNQETETSNNAVKNSKLPQPQTRAFTTPPNPMSSWWSHHNVTHDRLSFLLYLTSILLYLYPLSINDNYTSPTAQLDELHIFDTNPDVSGSAPFSHLWTNDYWGRSMNDASSHKSYRPLTITTLRAGQWMAEYGSWNCIWLQRCVNVMIHASLLPLLGRLVTLTVPSSTTSNDNNTVERGAWVYKVALMQMLFMLHPSHVEVVVNVANRAHLLSLLFGMMQLDVSQSIVSIGIFHICGLLSCETAIFQLPGILIGWIYTSLERDGGSYTLLSMKRTLAKLHVRMILVTSLSLTYLYLRHVWDWLSIPQGLIRPAENPFYALTGYERWYSYAYIASLHVIKSLGMGMIDLIGLSHEYGFNCIPSIQTWKDERLIIPLGLMGMVLIGLVHGLKSPRNALRFLLAMSWMATLFPISGIMKVGTFVADRLVVASTLVGSVAWGHVLTYWISEDNQNPSQSSYYTWRPKMGKILCLGIGFVYLWIKIHARSLEWMDSISLLESSLRTCPASAKSNLEMSKIYSGLFPQMTDLDKAYEYLEKTEEIDGDYCDVHYQFAQVLFQQEKYLEFEDRITKSVLCPFTMTQSYSLYTRYWKTVLHDSQGDVANAQRRYKRYNGIIEEAIKKETAKENAEKYGNKKLYSTGGKSEL